MHQLRRWRVNQRRRRGFGLHKLRRRDIFGRRGRGLLKLRRGRLPAVDRRHELFNVRRGPLCIGGLLCLLLVQRGHLRCRRR